MVPRVISRTAATSALRGNDSLKKNSESAKK